MNSKKINYLISMMRAKYLLVAGLAFSLGSFSASGQLLNKIKQKASQKAEQALDKKLGLGGNQNNPNNPGGQNGAGGPGNNGGPSNNSGGGLITTPPDVNQNIADAQTAYKSGSYGEARYSVQQAMLGVEMEIGNKVLESLPESIAGLPKESSADQVTSTGFGWVGLTVHREYNNDDKEFRVTVANNSAWMSAINMYMSSGGYSQTTGGEQNWKQTKLKGHRAIIEYNESSGYKLSVPIGQTSLIVYEGVNFASEPDMMKASEEVDIDGIKAMLGEK
ncbi:MAG: hypothetical protein AB7O48_01430 [Cyclobacteriaceae bacterium]